MNLYGRKSDFMGKVVWITGASSGIGEDLTYLFNSLGARTIISSNDEDALRRVKANCRYKEREVYVLPVDLSDFDTFDSKVGEVISAFGRVDVLVNNAGISHRSLAKDTSLGVLRKVIDVDLTGHVALTCAVLPQMTKQQAGHIVVTSSLAGKLAIPTRSAYCAAKHGLHGFYNSLRAEVWRDNIHVTLICPAGVRTNIGLNSLMGDGSMHGKTDKHIASGLPPDRCARLVVKAIVQCKEEVWLGRPSQRYPAYIAQWFPSVYSWLIKRVRALN